MRQYLYLLEIDRDKPQPIELRIIYAVDEEDAQRKATKRTIHYSGAQITLRRSETHFTVAHTTYPPYIDMAEGMNDTPNSPHRTNRS